LLNNSRLNFVKLASPKLVLHGNIIDMAIATCSIRWFTHTHTLPHSVLDICVYIYPDDHQSLWHANQKTRPADSALFSPNPPGGQKLERGPGETLVGGLVQL